MKDVFDKTALSDFTFHNKVKAEEHSDWTVTKQGIPRVTFLSIAYQLLPDQTTQNSYNVEVLGKPPKQDTMKTSESDAQTALAF